MAAEFLPVDGVSDAELAEAVLLSSLADETPEGRSIVSLAVERYGLDAGRELVDSELIPFTAQTRMSGVDFTDGSGRRPRPRSAVRPALVAIR